MAVTISSLQALLAAILTESFHKYGLPLKAIVHMLSSNPAQINGLYHQKDSLLLGSDADSTIVDFREEFTLSKEALHHENPHSPFIGQQFKGMVVQSILRGEMTDQDYVHSNKSATG